MSGDPRRPNLRNSPKKHWIQKRLFLFYSSSINTSTHSWRQRQRHPPAPVVSESYCTLSQNPVSVPAEGEPITRLYWYMLCETSFRLCHRSLWQFVAPNNPILLSGCCILGWSSSWNIIVFFRSQAYVDLQVGLMSLTTCHPRFYRNASGSSTAS